MKIGFFCFDNAGGDAMALLAKEAETRGHEVTLFPKQVRGLAKERGQELIDLDAMVTGLSSFETEQELEFADFCLKFQTPWFVFEDVPGACLRPKAKDYWAYRAKLVFLAHPSGSEAAKEFGYDGTVYLGPPPQWRLEYESLMQAKAENWPRRKKLVEISGVSTEIGLSKNDRSVGLILGKEPEENNRIIKVVKEALAGMDARGIVLVVGKHPGERPDPNKPGDEERFTQLFVERSKILEDIWVANTNDTKIWKGARIAGSADVMIYASGTNISIAGAYARVPGIYLNDEGVRARVKIQTGGETWFVAELGGAVKASSRDQLADAIQFLLTSAGQDRCCRQQEKAFPLPDDWHTERKIIEFLEKVM
ncbi:MAG: hypothetical protein AAB394_03150 [Patescibacteria group bacterium]